MPRGVYNRKTVKRRKTKAGPKSRVLKGLMKGGKKTVVKEIPKVISVLKPPAVIAAFTAEAREAAGVMQRQSLTLSCSAAVCLIVGAHANGDSMNQAEMIKRLKKSVAKTGLQESQVNKYIGLARALVAHLLVRFKIGNGPVNIVLTTDDVGAARDSLADYLAKNNVTTLEGMTKLFGKYQRKPAQARAPDGTIPGKAGNPAPRDGAPIKGQQPSPSLADGGVPDPAQVRDQLNAQLKFLPTEFVATELIRAGHVPVQVIEQFTPFIDSREDCAHLVRLFTDRAKHLDEVAAGIQARADGDKAAASTRARSGNARVRLAA